MRSRRPIGAAIGGAVLFAVAGVHLGVGDGDLARVSLLGAALGLLAYVDLTEHRIPNRIVVPASAACAALLFAEQVSVQRMLPSLFVVALMLMVTLVWPASFGMGDVKLA